MLRIGEGGAVRQRNACEGPRDGEWVLSGFREQAEEFGRGAGQGGGARVAAGSTWLAICVGWVSLCAGGKGVQRAVAARKGAMSSV